MGDDVDLDAEVKGRIAELEAKRRLSKAEREELEILTYDGPKPRIVPRSNEVPY